ncbi:CehA/McbA family metallohydrolase [Nonomuraea sp. K274]|uniref:CehA/McbA family metallohydrolase n=1 Tax=Nonomuraea cypriaca TaxID=1187855 RepID=A0A931F2G3_9ACTN|nr:CehA/McbA family metallohydrolase [Nonomuraea cypriaca]MBF8192934.1 CehA/McbA family metallohydrolase [Nonomuraea cypriaca]
MCAEPMLPGKVAGALEEYGRLLGEHGITWGEPENHYVKFFARRRVLPPALFDRFWELVCKSVAETHPGEPPDRLATRLDEPDYDRVLRDTLDGELPAHLVAVRVIPDGVEVEGTPRTVLLPTAYPPRQNKGDGKRHTPPIPLPDRGEEGISLLIDSSRDHSCRVIVDDLKRELGPRGAWLVEADHGSMVLIDGRRVRLNTLLRPTHSARLRLVAGMPCRWSVMSWDGQGWYPPGTPHRYDFHGRPYFHGDDVVVEVPAHPLTITVTRGMEHDRKELELRPEPGEEHLIGLTPERLYDAAARGWYGADMHVHLNWGGDVVSVPADAAAAQHGEDLHVLNLLAGNVSGRRVYDREALEQWTGEDLPWSDATHLARMGVEYRNDLLGHVYAFAPRAAPARFHTGFDGDADWPPNADGLRELRGLGALVGYSHPFRTPITDGAPPQGVVSPVPRNCAARELVADAALGLVDSLDVLTHASIASTAAVYRRLIGAGNRLAVTAGTDAMISFTRSDNQSNPPGWARVYARTDGPLTARAFAAAVRAGRTFATTGPWLELSVNGHGPGHVIQARRGDRISVTARAIGPEVAAVRIRTADGVRAGGERLRDEDGGRDEALSVTADLRLDGPTYVVAEVLCDPHPRTMTSTGYALTSPVYVDVDGRQVAREEDVRWCLEWLDLLEDLIRQHGRLASPLQFGDHMSLLEQARAIYRARLG